MMNLTLKNRQIDHLFLSGATGFLGRVLLEEVILQKSYQGIFVLVKGQSEPLLSAAERVAALLEEIAARRQWTIGRDGHTLYINGANRPAFPVTVVDGDVTYPDLGVKAAGYDFSRVTHVCHAAACTSFAASEEWLENVNIKGTKHMLDFARQHFANLQIFGYVGTAYDLYSGQETHVAAANSPDPEKFVNNYTRSKWFARKSVAASGLPHCIFLPGIITGYAADGYIPEDVPLGVIYAPLQGLALLKSACLPYSPQEDPLKVDFYALGDEEATLNILPVDTVAVLLDRILKSDQVDPGAIYFLTNPHPLGIGKTLEVAARIVGIEGIRLVNDLTGRTRLEKLFIKMLAPYRPFMLGKVGIYDMSNTLKIAGDVALPLPDEDLLIKLFEYVNNHRGWGFNQPGAIFKDVNINQLQTRFADDIQNLFK
jgi:nucleoside-diphosphate-sugar epimerase